jgi:parallel beta-helix repeat protein
MKQTLQALLLVPILMTVGLRAGAQGDPFADYTVVKIQKGPNALTDLKTALLTVDPGTIIQLPKDTIAVDEELSLSTDHVVIRGKGNKSVLDFSGQTVGGQGILISGDYVTLENFRIENTPGDGVRAEDVRGITFRDMWVGWTGGPSEENGAYAVYPVLAQDVLVEGCKIVGASDAGIYVGQSSNIIVRNNKVVQSVAGIEIENSNDADVHHNVVKGNTAGILVFNLPGLTMLGSGTRVYKNKIVKNNILNFGSGTVGEVPPGTGIIVLANDEVQIFKNEIRKNKTVAIALASYNIIDDDPGDEDYDAYSETLFIYDNEYDKNGTDPDQTEVLGFVVNSAYGGKPPTIVNLKDDDPDKLVEGEVPAELEICVQEDQKGVKWGEYNLYESLLDPMSAVVTKEPARKIGPPHDCTHPKLPKVVIPDAPAPPSPAVAAACAGGSPDAYLADCPRLSDYGLFADDDPRVPVAGGLPYDLTSPLFSDYANKYRAIFVPEGETIPYDADSVLDLPVGTILAKSFAFARDLNDADKGEDLIETRLLIHRPEGWKGLPYIWNAQETEAYLSVIGGVEEVAWTHTDESEIAIDYRIPNVNMCDRCHFDGPIGPKVRTLNRMLDYGDHTANQIDQWTAAGILTGAPDAGSRPYVPFPLDEGDGTLEERAKGYLEANCAHCHNEDGAARNTGMYLVWDAPLDTTYGLCKRTVAAGQEASGGFTYDIVPGNSYESILVYRLEALQPNVAMPELAKTLLHDEGIDLVAEWVDQLPGTCD